MEWRLTEAKNKFSQLVNRVLSDAPWRGDSVLSTSEQNYEHLTSVQKNFKDFLLASDPKHEGLDLERDCSVIRSVDL